MSKTIYLAGKLNTAEFTINELSKELEDRGHKLLVKWWEMNKLPTPYLDHPKTSIPAAESMVDAAYSSDVSIFFTEDNILGAAVELGAAIASHKTNPKKLIVVVNPEGVRQSVFYAHPAVETVRSAEEIRKMDWF